MTSELDKPHELIAKLNARLEALEKENLLLHEKLKSNANDSLTGLVARNQLPKVFADTVQSLESKQDFCFMLIDKTARQAKNLGKNQVVY